MSLREQEFIIEMHIEGEPITHFLSFHLSQSFNAHHYFELRVEHGKLGLPGLITMEGTRDYIGRKFVISFGYDQINLQNFRGMITQVSLEQSNGFQGEIVISGYSPTILIDRGPDLGSYLDRTLRDIVKTATNEVTTNDLFIAVNPSRTNVLDYVIQYRESDFDFLNRLSAEYFEWFYYDGEQLCFGKPDELPEAKLTYGQEIKSLNYGINIAPVKQKRFFYDAKVDEILNSESTGKADGHPDLLHALDRSNETYSKTFNQPVTPRIDSFGDLKNFVEYEEKANISQLLKLSAESDSPDVRIGSEIQVDTSVRQDLSFVTDTLGTFLITQVEHHIDGLGRYSNSFEGVVGGTERIPVKNYNRPAPDLQIANVVNNNDPKGQGRIKVRFKWECQSNDETEWLRVMTPDAGSSDEVSSNRGLMTIPEVGDQILVGFEEGNIARPVVMGSMFHGKSGTGGGSGNNMKSLSSKSGHTVELNDAGGITIKDKTGGNIIVIDGIDTISGVASKTIAFSNGKSSFIMDEENISIEATNIVLNGSSIVSMGSGKATVAVTSENNIALISGKTVVADATKDVQVLGKESTTINAKKLSMNGDTETKIEGGIVKINS